MLGVIGGSGLYDLPGLEGVRREQRPTPFGDPSDAILVGRLAGQPIAFLSRHGKGHRYSPSEVPYRANLHALKQVGVTRVISVSAVGSMKEEIAPGHLALPSQYIDRTLSRPRTFFGDGAVAHVAFADPVCPQLHEHLRSACFAAGATVHAGGTYLCIEGPQFSTRAESELYRGWKVDVIGMTALPEARLAREAELCYVTLALATDYDCWHAVHEAVNVAQVVETMRRNVELAREVVLRAALSMDAIAERKCGCGHALDGALITDPAQLSPSARERLALLLGNRFKA
ncbi:MAG TPA: S-methyl-5'-thioadenosine phosphorylase [Myxococcales bacterium]|nr:S-methyl-5'-thioadenosine phosphorylase [Myxococcales bacterium]